MVYQWINNRLHDWFPQSCVLCGQTSRDHALCCDCLHDLPFIPPSICQHCGLPLELSTKPVSCGRCLQQPPAYDRVISAFAYATPVSQLVSKLKFHGQLQLARLLGEMLAKHLFSAGPSVEALVPVPLHPGRLRQRGFNQALEIARPISTALTLPILHDAVYRQRETQPQAEQPASRRECNIRGAFTPGVLPAVKRLAIVDDVMTSGHTVGEIAKVLRQVGVEQIEVWCVARAWPRHF